MSGDNFVTDILADLDDVRGIPAEFGLNVFTVIVRKRVWTYAPGMPNRPGAQGSTKQDFDTILVNQSADGTKHPVVVRQLTRREVMASGGQYADRDLKVGPMTPVYASTVSAPAGGTDDSIINSPQTGSATEIIWILKTNDGNTHGLPPGGVVCELRGEEATALTYYAVLRATGRQPTS